MKRWPVIRYIRYRIALYRLYSWWHRNELGKWYVSPNPNDLEHLEGIRTGKW